jgi:HD-GYP domain-containing protein (c-di-GMP phosphodiesterase class II)
MENKAMVTHPGIRSFRGPEERFFRVRDDQRKKGAEPDMLMSNYLGIERKQTITRTIWVTVAACLVFGALNINMSSLLSAGVIFLAAGISLCALVVNYRNHQLLASIMVCVSVLITITFSVCDGDGLLDPGIVGYPLFILLGTLLLNKRFTIWLTLASILSLGLVAFLQVGGHLHLTIHENRADNFLPISVFLVAGAVVVWVILDRMESNIEKIRASESDLRKSYGLTIQVLSKTLDMRDASTGNHTHRVVELTEQLARAMGMDEPALSFMRYGAFLHDIGKMGVPDEILLKPGPLNDAEWQVMRTHPLKAEEMLKDIPYLQSALDIPRYHHERWDGNGYPYRVKGEKIPLPARVFSVVDVWDALTNVRPYRDAWPDEKALAYIAEEAGKQFDPQVVQVFLKMMKS